MIETFYQSAVCAEITYLSSYYLRVDLHYPYFTSFTNNHLYGIQLVMTATVCHTSYMCMLASMCVFILYV